MATRTDGALLSSRPFRVAAPVLACALAALILSTPAAAAEKAAALYRTYCMQCHGLAGNGEGINVRDMPVQPRDHTDAKAMSARSDDTLFTVIKNGGPSIDKSVIMPDWGGALSDDEIRSLIPYLRHLCKCQYGGQ